MRNVRFHHAPLGLGPRGILQIKLGLACLANLLLVKIANFAHSRLLMVYYLFVFSPNELHPVETIYGPRRPL
jgi:hypothetical protein